MAIRILTKAGVENTHIDEARGYNFDAANRSGIIQGVLNEGRFYAASSNIIALDTCELRIYGHRIVIDEPYTITMANTPDVSTRYSLIGEITVDNLSVPTFRLFVQPSSTALIQDNLYVTLNGQGTYQVEIGKFTLTPNDTIEDIESTIETITGDTYSKQYAQYAYQSSVLAQESANNSSVYADNAQRSANNASASATEAQGYANAIPTFELVGTTLYITTRSS